MFKFPLVVIYSIIALNISVFTGLLQADWLIIQSPAAKIIAWVFTIAAWTVAYINRHKFYTIRLTGKLPESKLRH
jgi:tellurite resistance protein TehA-like permease